jgi:hypothetical protein
MRLYIGRRQTALPWMSFGSDAAALAPEGVFLASSTHPRAYGNVARLLGKYVRDEKATTLASAVHRLSGRPAANLGLHDRGMLKPGYYADVVVFDPATIGDHATYESPRQFATGVEHVLVNGRLALMDGRPPGERPRPGGPGRAGQGGAVGGGPPRAPWRGGGGRCGAAPRGPPRPPPPPPPRPPGRGGGGPGVEGVVGRRLPRLGQGLELGLVIGRRVGLTHP